LTIILGVSRTSVRAALKELQAIGLLDVSAARGSFISTNEHGGIALSIRGWLEANRLSLLELIEFRCTLEPAAAALAARRRDADDLAFLRTQLEIMATAVSDNDRSSYGDADTDFHNRIAGAGRNPLFIAMTESTREVLRVHLPATSRRGAAILARSLADHQAIYGAISAGDEDAAHCAALSHIIDTAVEYQVIAREALER